MSLIKTAYQGIQYLIYNEGFEAGRDRERDEIMDFLDKWQKEKVEEGNALAATATGYIIRLLNGEVGTCKERKEVKEKLEVKDDNF